MTPGFREFEFDLPDALLKSIIDAFNGMESAPLNPGDLADIPEAQGVYQLLLGNKIVYIGKTDSEAGLNKRLARHAWTILHRQNLDVSDVSFKAIRVFVFTAMDLETQLINFYRGKSDVSWNNSGFGSNDPGRNRDWTTAKAGSFDVLYPLNLDEPFLLDLQGETAVWDVITALKRTLPYTLRVETVGRNFRNPHPDFLDVRMGMNTGNTTVREVLSTVVAGLPEGWQATALAGRVILYKEHVDNYPAGRIIARK